MDEQGYQCERCGIWGLGGPLFKHDCKPRPIGGFYYLGSPYSHPDVLVREWRYLKALEVTSVLLSNEIWTYSPIVHCHQMAKTFGMPTGYAFWQKYDGAMLLACRGMFVLTLEGWEKSAGLTDEIAVIRKLGKTVTYIADKGDLRVTVENIRHLHRSEQAAHKAG